MVQEEVRFNWYILAGILLLILVYSLRSMYTPTGLFLYQAESREQQWNFSDAASYAYDANMLQVSPGEVKLIPQTSTTTWTTEEITPISVTGAVLQLPGNGTEERTADVLAKDGASVTLQKETAVLDVTFAQALQNGDILSIYLLSQNNVETDVYMCDAGVACASPGYGSVRFSGQEGWHNLTLSGLPSATGTLAIDPPNQIKIDFVSASRTETIEHSNTTTSYPASASLETEDFQPAQWASWGIFLADADPDGLDGESIAYFYSADGGASWSAVASGTDLSSVDAGAIRLKAVLSSGGAGTPVLRSMSVGYTVNVSRCEESWSIQHTPCSSSNTRILYYLDANSCGTTLGLPSDNGTVEQCDYCAMNQCNASLIAAPVLSTEGNKSVWKVDARDSAKLQLEMEAFPGNVTIVYYESNIKSQAPAAAKALPAFVDITPGSDASPVALISAKIILHYTDEEIAASGIAEETLKIYYYNDTKQEWQALSTMVNASGNYAYALVEHLSLYGLFGEAAGGAATGSSDSSSGSGSGGGGGSGGGSGGGGGGSRSGRQSGPPAPAAEARTAEIALPVRTEPSEAENAPPEPKASCTYVAEILLPEEVDLVEKDRFTGEITNTGDCALPTIELQLSPELQDVAEIDSSPSALGVGERGTFILIRKSSAPLPFLLTSSVIGEVVLEEKQYYGAVFLEAQAEGESIYAQELPLRLLVREPGRLASPSMVGVAVLLLLLLLLVVAVIKWRK